MAHRPKVLRSPYRIKAANPQGNFTGEITDKLGRHVCFAGGKHTPCSNLSDEQKKEPTTQPIAPLQPGVAQRSPLAAPTSPQMPAIQESSSLADIVRVLAKIGGMGVKAAGFLWSTPDMAEHWVKEFVLTNYYRWNPEAKPTFVGPTKEPSAIGKLSCGAWWLTRKALTVAYTPWLESHKAAEKVALEAGAKPEQAKLLKHALLLNDAKLYKITLSAAKYFGPVGPAVAIPMSLVPMATSAYLAYSLAKNPVATWRVARKLVRGVWQEGAWLQQWLARKGKKPEGKALVPHASIKPILVGMSTHGDDAFFALFCVAWDLCHDMEQAVELADEAARQLQQQGR